MELTRITDNKINFPYIWVEASWKRCVETELSIKKILRSGMQYEEYTW